MLHGKLNAYKCDYDNEIKLKLQTIKNKESEIKEHKNDNINLNIKIKSLNEKIDLLMTNQEAIKEDIKSKFKKELDNQDTQLKNITVDQETQKNLQKEQTQKLENLNIRRNRLSLLYHEKDDIIAEKDIILLDKEEENIKYIKMVENFAEITNDYKTKIIELNEIIHKLKYKKQELPLNNIICNEENFEKIKDELQKANNQI